MLQYLRLLEEILESGSDRSDRTGVGTRGLFGRQMRFDLSEGFPLLTTKKLHVRSIFYELLWFLRGETNIAWLNENGVRIWDEWADENGDLGPVYGHQWRSFCATRFVPVDRAQYDQLRAGGIASKTIALESGLSHRGSLNRLVKIQDDFLTP